MSKNDGNYEIMGFYRIETSKYMIPKGAKRCPFKRSRSIYNGYCDRSKCACWNNEENRCGMLRR